jgi:hypothetical protein
VITAEEAWLALGGEWRKKPKVPLAVASNRQLWRLNVEDRLALVEPPEHEDAEPGPDRPSPQAKASSSSAEPEA